jgi:alpha-tubulin suppressor-like RCC1 family protein
VLSAVPVRSGGQRPHQRRGGTGRKGGTSVLSLRSDGTVWGWGRNDFHQLGDLTQPYSFAPVQIHGLPPGIVQVAGGLHHSLAVAADGSVWTWGSNAHGALGYPTPGADSSPTPHQVPGLSGVRQVAAGEDFTVALRSNGEVSTWGRNDIGQLGNGTLTDRTTPARNLTGYGITQVSAGRYYALALRPGSVWAWGDNYFGELGNGSAAAHSATPVIVDRRTQNATQIVAGTMHAFRTAGPEMASLWAWGDNKGPAVRGDPRRAGPGHRPGAGPGGDHAACGRRAAG